MARGNVGRLLRAWLLLGGVLVLGCIQRYEPKVTLSESPRPIPLTAELHPFQEASATREPGEPYGVVAPRVRTIEPGDLAEPVTHAILEDFRENHVFEHIDLYTEDPGVIVTGTIRKFYEIYRPQLWTVLPGATVLAKFVQANTYTSTAEVDLVLILLNRTGTPVARYRGHAAKTDDFTPSHHNTPGARLNWALSESVHQVRQALLQDATRLLAIILSERNLEKRG